MSAFDTLIIVEVALDTNVDYDGTTVQAIGGAVYYSGFAAANIGHKIAVQPKADTAQIDLTAAFAPAPNITVYPLHSRTSFVTKNIYHTPDRERRTSTVDSVVEPYRSEEVPDVDAAIWHLAGLAAGVSFLQEVGVENVHAHLAQLAHAFEAGARSIPGVVVLGGYGGVDRSGIVALNVGEIDSALVADRLAQEFDICVRAGAHCAPLMHKALGTDEQGAVRFSFSWFNTQEEVEQAVDALSQVAHELSSEDA